MNPTKPITWTMHFLTAIVACLFAASSASAQSRASGPAPNDFPVSVDLAAGFTAIHANAQPGACGCFYMDGGSAEISFSDPSGVALLFNFGDTRVSNINGGGHDLRLITYLAGGRYSHYSRSRFTPFGQLLLGTGNSSTNFAIDHSTSSIAFAGGGGLDFDISQRFSLRLLQAEYLLTHVPNATNNEQNQLRLTAGVVFHLTRPLRNVR